MKKPACLISNVLCFTADLFVSIGFDLFRPTHYSRHTDASLLLRDLSLRTVVVLIIMLVFYMSELQNIFSGGIASDIENNDQGKFSE